MVTVHHLNNSRSQRVLWMLEELGVSYEIKPYQRDVRTMLAPSALKKVHPLGKSPVITDGDETIAESGAIIEYLLERYGNGRFQPKAGTPERRRYVYWLHYAEGSLMPLLVMKLVFARIPKSPAPFFVKPLLGTISRNVIRGFIDPQLRTHLSWIESELAGRPYFAGEELTGADVQMSFPLEAASARGGLGPEFPRIQNWLDRVRARPAYQAALKKGGPFEILRG